MRSHFLRVLRPRMRSLFFYVHASKVKILQFSVKHWAIAYYLVSSF
ncbi:hypothetical protein ACF3DV_29745 [Chlorogloeopsis fritschii PCC 9212]|nr:hypothetical protein [Chlorogloeopsis fritschii]